MPDDVDHIASAVVYAGADINVGLYALHHTLQTINVVAQLCELVTLDYFVQLFGDALLDDGCR